MSGRGKRVLVYTAALLCAPLPVMPYAPGTREFAAAVSACGAVLVAASFYVARGELRLRARGLVGTKLLASSLITLVFGLGMLVGATHAAARRMTSAARRAAGSRPTGTASGRARRCSRGRRARRSA
jgi:hypothetical protein